MKIPYFFKAKSRIGLPYKPIHQNELNLGVEDGPDSVFNADFLKQFPKYKSSEFSFPKPEDILNRDFDIVLATNIKKFKEQINKKIAASQASSPRSLVEAGRNDGLQTVQVIIGGDHSMTFPSILADLERVSDTKVFRLIHCDSHGDMNMAKDSPTDNFHGMYLRPFFDDFDIPEIAKLMKRQLKPKNCLFIGNLDLDEKEKEFFINKRFKNIDRNEIKSYSAKVTSFFREFINSADYLHISFDIDIFDKTISPATGIPAEHGLFKKDILPLLKIISKHPNFSFDLCEVNPKKRGASKTIKLAQEILKTVLL